MGYRPLYVFGFRDPFSNLSLVEADTTVDELLQVPALLKVMPEGCGSC